MQEFPSALKLATVWLLLGTLVFLAFQAWQAHQRRSQFNWAGGVIELRRAADGHFYWPGRVDGVEVEFLVDTGATTTALPQRLAERLKLESIGEMTSSTAGGTAHGWIGRVRLDLDGGVQVQRLRVGVLPALQSPLLGMDVLSHLRFSQQAGTLRIEAAR